METTKKQLIVFVNQLKFFSLFSQNIYSMTDNQIAFFDKSLIINGYVSVSNHVLASSLIIIKPDASTYNYTPTCPFKILLHGETQKYSVNNGLKNLKKDKNCAGWQEQPEEKGTLYEDIVNLINAKNDCKSFEDIYKSIAKKNVILEIALEFLHGCLGDNTTIPSLPDEFQNCQNHYDAFQTDRNNKNLRNLRDEMLIEAGVT